MSSETLISAGSSFIVIPEQQKKLKEAGIDLSELADKHGLPWAFIEEGEELKVYNDEGKVTKTIKVPAGSWCIQAEWMDWHSGKEQEFFKKTYSFSGTGRRTPFQVTFKDYESGTTWRYVGNRSRLVLEEGYIAYKKVRRWTPDGAVTEIQEGEVNE